MNIQTAHIFILFFVVSQSWWVSYELVLKWSLQMSLPLLGHQKDLLLLEKSNENSMQGEIFYILNYYSYLKRLFYPPYHNISYYKFQNHCEWRFLFAYKKTRRTMIGRNDSAISFQWKMYWIESLLNKGEFFLIPSILLMYIM